MQMLSNYKGKKSMLDMTNGPIVSQRDQEEIIKYNRRKKQIEDLKEEKKEKIKYCVEKKEIEKIDKNILNKERLMGVGTSLENVNLLNDSNSIR